MYRSKLSEYALSLRITISLLSIDTFPTIWTLATFSPLDISIVTLLAQNVVSASRRKDTDPSKIILSLPSVFIVSATILSPVTRFKVLLFVADLRGACVVIVLKGISICIKLKLQNNIKLNKPLRNHTNA